MPTIITVRVWDKEKLYTSDMLRDLDKFAIVVLSGLATKGKDDVPFDKKIGIRVIKAEEEISKWEA